MTIYNDGATINLGPGSLSGPGSMLLGSPADIHQNATIAANLLRTVNIKNVRAVSSTRIRVEFTQAIINDVDSLLGDPDSFVLTAQPGSVTPVISRVDTPDGATATFSIDLIVSELTTGTANYSLQAHGLFSQDNSPISNDAFTFNGFGVAPKVLVAFATSANSVTVQFSEKVLDIGSLRTTTAYVFDGGLSATGVLGVDASSVTLKTSAQTAGHLYHLTMTGSWYDNSLNQMVSPSISPVLGFTASVAKSALLSLKMYNFLIEGLRNSDQNEGKQFLERFLAGPQSIWAATMQTIFDLPNLWDVSAIPDELLQYLKRIVGWTPDLDNITSDLDPATLRRLIAASVRFWKTRGPEESISNILSLTTGARVYVQNWFDLRFILDQTMNGEEDSGTDPWVLSTPGEGDPDSQTYNIRIVDDGNLNHALVRNLAKLTRPSGERIQINYLGFLDRFEADDDETQWAFQTVANTSHLVSNGALTLSTTTTTQQLALVTALNNQDWTRQVISWTFSTNMSRARFLFYVVGDTTNPNSVQDFYWIRVNTADAFAPTFGRVQLFKKVAGVDTLLATADLFVLYGEPIYTNVTYTLRVEVTPLTEGVTTNSIKVYWDGEPIIELTSDATFTQGSIGVGTDSGQVVPTYLTLKEVEMFFLPRALDLIDLGNAVTSIIPQPAIPPTAPPIYVPTSETSPLRWTTMLDASSYVITGGTTVTDIKNKVSNVHATESTAPPSYQSTGLNGHPCMRFVSGSLNKMISGIESALGATLSGTDKSWTLYKIMAITTPSVTGIFDSVSSSTTSNRAIVCGETSSTFWNLLIDDLAANHQLLNPATVSGMVRVYMAYDGATNTLKTQVNGGAVQSAIVSSATLSALDRWGFGCRCDQSPDSFSSYDEGETIMYGDYKAPGSAADVRIQNYLAAAWA